MSAPSGHARWSIAGPRHGPLTAHGIERVVVDRGSPRAAELPEEDREVRRDQRVGDEREPPHRDVVEQRQHYGALSPSTSRSRASPANMRLFTVPSGTPSRLGDLRLREPAVVGELERLALERRQLLERRLHVAPELARLGRLVGRVA